MAEEKAQSKKLQWHPAFFAGIQIELEEEQEKLIFENEHQLNTKPLGIDVLVIKKEGNAEIRKNLGRIFRKHNILEYKSPEDSLTIDDFYKVYAYACLYKADTARVNEIKAEDITLTFVTKKFPYKMVQELQQSRKMELVKFDEGIYHLIGDFFPIQLIHTSELSAENNFWLKNLTNDLKGTEEVQELIKAYDKRKKENLYQSVMNVIVKANIELFEEVEDMCDALMEIVQPKVDAKIREARIEARIEALEEGRREGRREGRKEGRKEAMKEMKLDLIRKKLAKGLSAAEIAECMEEPVGVIKALINSIS